MPRKQVDRVARFVWVVDGEPELRGKGPNRVAAEQTLAAVRALGRVEPIDEALTSAFVLLGEAVDNDPTNAALWGQYRASEESLRGLGGDANEDAFAEFLAGLSSEVRDAEVGEPQEPRASRRKGGGSARAAVDAVAASGGGRRKRDPA